MRDRYPLAHDGTQIATWIGQDAAIGNAEPEYLAAIGSNTVGHFGGTPLLDLLERIEHHASQDGSHRHFTKRRKYIRLQPPITSA